MMALLLATAIIGFILAIYLGEPKRKLYLWRIVTNDGREYIVIATSREEASRMVIEYDLSSPPTDLAVEGGWFIHKSRVISSRFLTAK
jgi:hypothetical protein